MRLCYPHDKDEAVFVKDDQVRFSAYAGRMTIRLGELAPAECGDMEESKLAS